MFTFMTGIIAILIVLAIFIIRNVIHICPPNKVLIFSGRYRNIVIDHGDQQVRKRVGYRIIRGGRGFRWPLFETVDSLDLTNINIEVKVEDAYAKNAIPLSVAGIANLKIAGDEPIIRNSIERFLGRPRSEIIRIAQETLEGNLRGVLATMTPEEVNEDRIRFIKELQNEADEDLAKLGLVLDTLKIQNISDKVQYLESIGRIRNADVQRDARVAQAKNWAEATVREAINRKEKEIMKIQVGRRTAEAEFAKRLKDAITRREAVIAEERGKVAAQVAKAEAELFMQTARKIQVTHQLEADMIAPAIARRDSDLANAEGAVAQQIEEGRARAAALRAIVLTWKACGDSGRDIFMLQKLDAILPKTLEVLTKARVDRITYLGAGDSAGGRSARLVEEIKASVGVDLSKIGRRLEGPAQ
ncbi:flotillin family protein [Myxococcota bacterium]|nr:flotillin family protein [Myxococcota bacterium]